MTKLLDKAFREVSKLSEDSQDEIASIMLEIAAAGVEPEPVDQAHLPAVLDGLAQARRREFATDAEVETAFRRFER